MEHVTVLTKNDAEYTHRYSAEMKQTENSIIPPLPELMLTEWWFAGSLIITTLRGWVF